MKTHTPTATPVTPAERRLGFSWRGFDAARRVVAASPLVLALVFSSLACGATVSSASPAASARTYMEAILARDGKTLCPLLDPSTRLTLDKLLDPSTRLTLDKLVASVRGDNSFPRQPNCANVLTVMLGYPHENMACFTGGKLLSTGRSHPITVGHHRYIGVEVRIKLRTERTGYAPFDTTAHSPTLTDTVWLTRTPHGWRTAKPSLAFLAAEYGDVLGTGPRMTAYARQALQPPTR